MLSIITPFYNTSNEYIKRLVLALEEQSDKDFEWIIVDDFSISENLNNLKKNLDKSKIKYILLFNDANIGAAESRNRGLEVATGEYVVFLDSDDYVTKNFVKTINLNTKNNQIDAFIFDFYTESNGKKERKYTLNSSSNGLISSNDALMKITSNICGKVIKKEIIVKNKITFPGIKRFEDWVFMTKCISLSDNIQYMSLPLYIYVNNQDSVVHEFSKNTIEYVQKAFEMIETSKLVKPDIVEALFIREVFYSIIKAYIKEYTISETKRYILGIECKYKNWKNNPYMNLFPRNQKIILGLYKYKMLWLIKLIVKFMQLKEKHEKY